MRVCDLCNGNNKVEQMSINKNKVKGNYTWVDFDVCKDCRKKIKKFMKSLGLKHWFYKNGRFQKIGWLG